MVRTLCLLTICSVGCAKSVPPAPRNYVKEYLSSSDPSSRQRALQGILQDSGIDIDATLMKIDKGDQLTAVDPARNLVYHNSSREETYYFHNGRGHWSSAKPNANIKEVIWLGNASGKAFGFPHQEYSLFLAAHDDETSYHIIFIIRESGRPTGMNMGLLTDPHYQILNDLGVWPEGWTYEAGNSQTD